MDVAYRGLAMKDIADLRARPQRRQQPERRRGHQRRGPAPGLQHEGPGRRKEGRAQGHGLPPRPLRPDRDVYKRTAEPLYSVVPAGITGHNTAFFDKYGDRPQPGRPRPALRTRASPEGQADPVGHARSATAPAPSRASRDRQAAQRQRAVRRRRKSARRPVREGRRRRASTPSTSRAGCPTTRTRQLHRAVLRHGQRPGQPLHLDADHQAS